MQENVKISRAKKKAGREVYNAHFQEVKEGEACLACDWNDLEAWERLNLAQHDLEEVRMDRLERQKNKAGATWAWWGEKCLKEFFQCHKILRPKTAIRELQDGGRLLKTQEEISTQVFQYYKDLYRFNPLTEINAWDREICIRNIPRSVT